MKDEKIKKVLIIGSGPIVIGQACEFDYSGSQAALALKEEGIETIVLNNNPATIMTDSFVADKVYLLPIELESVEKILKEERPDAVLLTMGGQTALNVGRECNENGLFEMYGCKPIGVSPEAIEVAESRELFKKRMQELGVPVPPSKSVKSVLDGIEAVEEIGLPVIIRPSYMLGGSGSSIVLSKENLEKALINALKASPIHEVLVEKALIHWKEFELEVMKDADGNFIVVCAIENVHPMGIHTGDSITVAPALTLPDKVYQKMRDYAKAIMLSFKEFAGGCNVQFAVSPVKEEIYIIEINPRVSRSSALASKATGYPIARIAAKLAIGYRLHELKNQITGTNAFFEPAIDYVVVKIPRWDFQKFPGADRHLSSQMKSIGEVMAIGKTFKEAIQKAVRGLELGYAGLGTNRLSLLRYDQILPRLENPSWDHIFRIFDALKAGMSIRKIHQITGIDKWFLNEIEELVNVENELLKYNINNIPSDLLQKAKDCGFTDEQIAYYLKTTPDEIAKLRKKLEIRPVFKVVDTCSAEFPAITPYYYSTYNGVENESPVIKGKKKVLIIGSGPNRIGQGIEFDYCCVQGIIAAKQSGYYTIMVNSNPETVSTDFSVADKLYFEPLDPESIMNILEHEEYPPVIIQLGGQTPLKLGEYLYKKNIRILGTQWEHIDISENREKFSKLMNELDIPYPRYKVVHSVEEALKVGEEIGFPLLVRPSYVLGGQRMRIVLNSDELENHLLEIFKEMPNNSVILDEFIDGAIEAEIDAICDGVSFQVMGVMEHIEPGGIHSGDSYAVLPPFSLSPLIIETMEEYASRIALALNVRGLINTQFLISNNEKVYVIEANLRASRTMPFICKAYKIPFLQYATQIILGTKTLRDFKISIPRNGYAIKIPVMSLDKLPGAEMTLGPEMKSTGEAIYFISSLKDPFFRQKFRERKMYLTR